MSVVIAVIGCYVDPQMVALSSLPTLKRELFDGRCRKPDYIYCACATCLVGEQQGIPTIYIVATIYI